MIHQVAVQLQTRCNCNVRMNTFYTWKPYSDIYWNNSETIALTVELRAWMKVTQYCWHNCKEKISEKWRNIGKNRKSEVYQVTLAIKSYNFSHYCFGFWRGRMVFGSFGNDPIQSYSVCHVVLLLLVLLLLAPVYSPPSDSFGHRNFISCKYMYLHP